MFRYNLIAVLVVLSMSITAALAADKFVQDPAHTNIGFQVKHMVITTVTGNFTDYDYSFMYDGKNPENSSIKATIKTASINTNNEKRDNHLRSADFFDAEKYCKNYKGGGFRDWRMPTLDELKTIYHSSAVEKNYHVTKLIKIHASRLWSSERIGENVYFLNMETGQEERRFLFEAYNPRHITNTVLPVRSATP